MKTITKVFIVIGALLLCVIIWDLVFNDSGILATIYNGVANVINDIWESITGSGDDLLPEWDNGAGTGGGAEGTVDW